MEMQREAPMLHDFASADMVTIGGFVQMVTVAKDEITTRIIHRWPDEIGRQIVS